MRGTCTLHGLHFILGFDSFGNNLTTQYLAKFYHAFDNRQGPVVGAQALHKAAIDLELVERKVANIGKA